MKLILFILFPILLAIEGPAGGVTYSSPQDFAHYEVCRSHTIMPLNLLKKTSMRNAISIRIGILGRFNELDLKPPLVSPIMQGMPFLCKYPKLEVAVVNENMERRFQMKIWVLPTEDWELEFVRCRELN